MAFIFRLETINGAPADPATLTSARPDWAPGHTIPMGHKTLRVVGFRDDDAGQPPVLMVEDLA
jgi:hypothetical protein